MIDISSYIVKVMDFIYNANSSNKVEENLLKKIRVIIVKDVIKIWEEIVLLEVEQINSIVGLKDSVIN